MSIYMYEGANTCACVCLPPAFQFILGSLNHTPTLRSHHVGGGDDGEVDVIVALELRGRDDDLGRFRVAGGREGGKEGNK